MSRLRVSDYVFKRLAEYGVRHVFVISGGGAMYLNQGLAQQDSIQYICNHHEQACAIAAEGYARMTGKLGVVSVTSGPGGINALNGVFGAWTDSIPMLIISGQVKRETMANSHRLPGLRQLGDQEANVIEMVKGITKYAVVVDDPALIRYHLERALRLATDGRPGPVWLDIPVDVQAAMVEEADLQAYDRNEDPPLPEDELAAQVEKVLAHIRQAKRPVIMVGSGVRLSGGVETLRHAAEKLGIPITTAWTAPDAFPTDHPLNCGRPGTIGDRSGNFTVQNSDLLLVIGCRLNIRQVSYGWKHFARHALLIQVDVDPIEMQKPTVRPHLPIVADAEHFLRELCRQLEQASPEPQQHGEWLNWCQERKARYDLRKVYPEISHGQLNPYWFVHTMFQAMAEDDVLVCGNAAASVIPFQIGTMRDGQRMWANSGCASMGYDLPAALGAAIGRAGARVICLAGDGSLQMNIQELQTVVQHRLNLKIFVLNNNGYLSMRQTQQSFFGKLMGESETSGVSFPDYVELAGAYGIPAFRIDQANYKEMLPQALSRSGPVLCEVMVDPEQPFEPKLSSRTLPNGRIVSSPLEDMAPFLSREELAENMLVPLVEE